MKTNKLIPIFTAILLILSLYFGYTLLKNTALVDTRLFAGVDDTFFQTKEFIIGAKDRLVSIVRRGPSSDARGIIDSLVEEIRINDMKFTGPEEMLVRSGPNEKMLDIVAYGVTKKSFVDDTTIDDLLSILENRLSSMGFQVIKHSPSNILVKAFVTFNKDNIMCVYEKRTGENQYKRVVSFGCY